MTSPRRNTALPAGGPSVRPGLKLWLSSDEVEGVFGDGKWRLLQAIHETGSLKAATEVMGISYRKAWGELRRAEQALGIELTEKRRGGSEGGETCLTEAGRSWLEAYSRFRSKVEAAVEREFAREILRGGKK